MASNTPRVCHLLELPAELRNCIYRHALLDSHKIRILQTAFNEPGLLRTCRHVRQEAEPIFLFENKFDTIMTDYNPIALESIGEKFSRIQEQYQTIPETTFSMRGAPNWRNFLEWMKKVHQEQAGFMIPLSYGAGDTGLLGIERQTLGTISSYVYNNREMEWERVERMVERLHFTLKTANPLWT